MLDELESLVTKPYKEFVGARVVLRAAERNFQLLVETASDINANILIEKGRKTPETYKQSFSDIGRERVVGKKLAAELVMSAKLRNILVHNYDMEEDEKKFFAAAKRFVPAYREYLRAIHKYTVA